MLLTMKIFNFFMILDNFLKIKYKNFFTILVI